MSWPHECSHSLEAIAGAGHDFVPPADKPLVRIRNSQLERRRRIQKRYREKRADLIQRQFRAILGREPSEEIQSLYIWCCLASMQFLR